MKFRQPLSGSRFTPIPQISHKSTHNFQSYPADRQTSGGGNSTLPQHDSRWWYLDSDRVVRVIKKMMMMMMMKMTSGPWRRHVTRPSRTDHQHSPPHPHHRRRLHHCRYCSKQHHSNNQTALSRLHTTATVPLILTIVSNPNPNLPKFNQPLCSPWTTYYQNFTKIHTTFFTNKQTALKTVPLSKVAGVRTTIIGIVVVIN